MVFIISAQHLACVMGSLLKCLMLVLVSSPHIVSAQYDDFYKNLDALWSESLTQPATSSQTLNPTQAAIPSSQGEHLNSLSTKSLGTASPKTTAPIETKGLDQDVVDINTWDYIPAEFFAPALPTTTPAVQDGPWLRETFGSLFIKPSISDAMRTPGKNDSARDAVETTAASGSKSGPEGQDHVDHSIMEEKSTSNNRPHNFIMPNINSQPQTSGQIFLPLADHIGGASLSINPDQLHDWSALPLSPDTHEYTNPPTVAPTPKINFIGWKSLAEAILRGKAGLWEWSYVSQVLEGEVGFYNATEGSADWISCCRHLPYICSMDAVCQLSSRQCHEFCECSANPAMSHCVRVIPEIKKTMAILEKEMLARVARELDMKLPPHLGTAMPEWNYVTEATPAVIPRGSTATSTEEFASTSSQIITTQETATPMHNPHTTLQTKDSRITRQAKPSKSPQHATTEVYSKSTFISSLTTQHIFNVKQTAPATATSTESLFTTTSATSLSTLLPQSTQHFTTSHSLHSFPSSTTSTLPYSTAHTKTSARASGFTGFPEFNSTHSKLIHEELTTRTSLVETSSSDTAEVSLRSPVDDNILAETNQNAIDNPSNNFSSAEADNNDSGLSFTGFALEPVNESTLVDITQENSMFAWFRSNEEKNTARSTLLATTVNPEPLANVTSGLSNSAGAVAIFTTTLTTATIQSTGFQFCNDDCDTKGGTCVMGNDFRPHCIIVAADACEHFHCVHGQCVSDDGVYTCECSHGWAGTFCDTPCPLDCGQFGYCSTVGERESSDLGGVRVNTNDNHDNTSNGKGNSTENVHTSNETRAADIACICHWNRTGPNCGERRDIVPLIYELEVPADDFHAWQVALVSILSAITLALFCVLVPYFLWRKSWLPMRKLVFFFQEFEDDDDKDYDAFVSFKSSPRDERFVLQHLYPKLEKELGFRLCLHFRDFPPGEPIANNIIHAVERSRRTILVLSPSYVSSEWCRLEYQKAQQEMLKLRHKIIPVVLEDVRKVSGMDKTLQTIMDTVTYIEWPGDKDGILLKGVGKGNINNGNNSCNADIEKFWNLLACSMPKKRKKSCGASAYSRSVSRTSDDLPLTAVGEAAMAVSMSARLPPVSTSSKSGFNGVSGFLPVIEAVRDSCHIARENGAVEKNVLPTRSQSTAGFNGISDGRYSIHMHVSNISQGNTGSFTQLQTTSPRSGSESATSASISLSASRDEQPQPSEKPTEFDSQSILISEQRLANMQERSTRINIDELVPTPGDHHTSRYQPYSTHLGHQDPSSASFGRENQNELPLLAFTINSTDLASNSTDSGVVSSGDWCSYKGSSNSSNRSITSNNGSSSSTSNKEPGESLPHLCRENKLKQEPGERSVLSSSDDHIVEIRNIGNKVIITPRPRTAHRQVKTDNKSSPLRKLEHRTGFH